MHTAARLLIVVPAAAAAVALGGMFHSSSGDGTESGQTTTSAVSAGPLPQIRDPRLLKPEEQQLLGNWLVEEVAVLDASSTSVVAVDAVTSAAHVEFAPLNGDLYVRLFDAQCIRTHFEVFLREQRLEAGPELMIAAVPCSAAESPILNEVSECLQSGCPYSLEEEGLLLRLSLLGERNLLLIREEGTSATSEPGHGGRAESGARRRAGDSPGAGGWGRGGRGRGWAHQSR